MGKFSTIAQGKRARKNVELPLDGHEKPTPIDLRMYMGDEEVSILESAAKLAEKRKAPSVAGNPVYELGRMVATLAIACIDPDSPPESPAPFFDGGEQQILAGLDPDRIAWLYEQQQAWQDECSPRPRSLTAAEYMQSVLEMAGLEESEDLPFERWRPVLRRSWVRSTARLLTSYLWPKYSAGAPSGSTGSNESSPPNPITSPEIQ